MTRRDLCFLIAGALLLAGTLALYDMSRSRLDASTHPAVKGGYRLQCPKSGGAAFCGKFCRLVAF